MPDGSGTTWYVYIVRCENNALYTGISTDVKKRVEKHNSGKGSKSVRAHGLPVTLVYKEKANSFSNALRREAEIKKMKKAHKELMISKASKGE